MADDFVVSGADDFLRLSKALKDAGRTGTRKEFHKVGKEALKPAAMKAKQAFSRTLPGPLASKGGNTKINAAVNTAGVRLVVTYRAKAGRGLHGANAQLANSKGLIRHPLFGDRDRWFTTPVPQAVGWFDNTIRGEAPQIRRDLEQVVDNISAQIIQDARL